MPRLPTAEQLGERPTPSVRGGIAPLNLRTPRQGQEAAALEDFGKAVSGLGTTLAELAIREKMDLDSARIEESTTEYSGGLMNYELGEEGFTRMLGGDAVKAPLAEFYQKKREDLAKTIREKLANDEQRIAFDRRVQILDQQFNGRLMRHVADQTRAYQATVSEGVILSERQNAALNFRQPGQIEMSILRTNMEIERKARIDGLNPEDPDDLKVIDSLKRIAETQIHANVIEQMILQGQDDSAAVYYGMIKDRLTAEAIVTVGGKVHEATVEGSAIRGVDMVWQTYGPQSLIDPVRLDIMENELRAQYRDNPETMAAAIKDLRSRAVAHNDSRQQVTADNKAKVLDAYHQGADLKQLQAMPEYWALDGEERIRLRDYVVSSGWTEQQRARAELQYQEGEKARAGFRLYSDISNPRVLSVMSENQIWALEPEIGQTLTGQLIEAKRKLNTPAKVLAATIDAELFNVLAAESGLNPYGQQTAEQKEILGRLRNKVETEIDAAQQRKGSALTRQEKEEIMRIELDQKVMQEHWYGDEAMPAAVIRPEQREDVYVPIAQIDPTWLKQAMNMMRSIGAVPVDMRDEDIKKKFKGRLERAYAIDITGGARDESKKALEGK